MSFGAPWGDETFAAVLATLGAGLDMSYGEFQTLEAHRATSHRKVCSTVPVGPPDLTKSRTLLPDAVSEIKRLRGMLLDLGVDPNE